MREADMRKNTRCLRSYSSNSIILEFGAIVGYFHCRPMSAEVVLQTKNASRAPECGEAFSYEVPEYYLGLIHGDALCAGCFLGFRFLVRRV